MTTFQAAEGVGQEQEEALHSPLGDSLATTLSSGSGIETTGGGGEGGGEGSPFSSFVLSFHGEGARDEGAVSFSASEVPAVLAAAAARARSMTSDAAAEGREGGPGGTHDSETADEEDRKLPPDDASAVASEAGEGKGAEAADEDDEDGKDDEQGGAGAVAGASMAPAPRAAPPPLPATMGDEYRAMVQQKAKGEERLKALLASKEHARRSFPRIRRVYQDHYLKIMVAGESGHGKTSFINNLFLSYTSGKEVKPHDGSRTRVEDFLADPGSLCTRFSIENDATLERMHYTIQDTPGYGDDTDIGKSIGMIIDYVDRSNARYLDMETDAARVEALGRQEDPRVDVCLYFIAAHRLKLIDIRFMQAIAAKVSLIPIIAKADSMTAEETVAFRSFVMAECERHDIKLFDFGAEAKAGVGIPADLVVPPFAVVASNKFDEVRGSGSFWPVRDYHWGTCEAFSTQHSDCTYLKRLLLEEGFHDLRRTTEDRYLEYRRDRLQTQAQAAQALAARNSQALRRGLGLAAFAALVMLVLTTTALLPSRASSSSALAGAGQGGPLAWLLGRAGGYGGGGGSRNIRELSARLEDKEAELAAAHHKIELLMASVRGLEASMTRLVGSMDGEHGSGGATPGRAPPLGFVQVDDDVSAKSLSDIDRLLASMGFGGVLTDDLFDRADEAAAKAFAFSSSSPPPPPLAEALAREEQPQPQPPSARARGSGGAGAGTEGRHNNHSNGDARRQHRRSSPHGGKHRCFLGGWLEGMARFHEEHMVDTWDRIMRFIL